MQRRPQTTSRLSSHCARLNSTSSSLRVTAKKVCYSSCQTPVCPTAAQCRYCMQASSSLNGLPHKVPEAGPQSGGVIESSRLRVTAREDELLNVRRWGLTILPSSRGVHHFHPTPDTYPLWLTNKTHSSWRPNPSIYTLTQRARTRGKLSSSWKNSLSLTRLSLSTSA